MRTALIITLVLALVVTLAPAARAADDGNTQLKLSSGYLYYPNDYADVINTTGTGNLKSIRCSGITSGFTVQLTVNGGTTQSLTNFGDQGADSCWIPMNIRFTSSIHLKLVNGSGYQNSGMTCTASWGLD